ncbi:MAG: cytochrome C-binding protein [Rhodanobacteraceae bacterium]|nr:MAG: cytochrome C-binding protein [Rhodanobacteraceae bacterium]
MAAAIGDAPSSSDAAIRAAKAPENPPATKPAAPPDDKMLQRIPGSTQAYSLAQTKSLFVAPDWWPQDHPPMPQIVAYGRGEAWACGHCHLPTGLGRPEDAAVAGLPLAYIMEQFRAFRDGERDSPIMHEELSRVSDVDLKLAAEYFSKLHFTPWTRVIEAARVPRTHQENFTLAVTDGAGTEPIGNRVIIVPANLERTMLGDARSGYIAHVPPGSIERGAAIAAKGTGAASACESCHGTRLQGQVMPGIGIVPPLAGRMPNYIVRELIRFREGKRTNSGAAPMRTEVAHLSMKDMIDVAAYAASRKP